MSSGTIPVTYADIGKSASDILTKDFPVGTFKLEAKSTASNGVTFSTSGARDAKSGTISGELKTKYAYPKSGVAFTGTWTTANLLNCQLELENNVAKGLKFDIQTSLLPAQGQKNAKAGATWKQAGIHTKGYLDLFKGPTVTGDVVLGHEGFLLGSEAAYDVMDGRLIRYGVALGYAVPDNNMSLRMSNSLNAFTALFYHRPQRDLELGAKAHWDTTSSNSTVMIEVGGKYTLDKDTFVKLKIDNSGRCGFGYTQALRPGVKISLGANIDTSRLNESAHRFGVALNLEA